MILNLNLEFVFKLNNWISIKFLISHSIKIFKLKYPSLSLQGHCPISLCILLQCTTACFTYHHLFIFSGFNLLIMDYSWHMFLPLILFFSTLFHWCSQWFWSTSWMTHMGWLNNMENAGNINCCLISHHGTMNLYTYLFICAKIAI